MGNRNPTYRKLELLNKTFYMAESQNYTKIELKNISNLKKNV